MKISIITTVYKAEKDLSRLLDSMMAQKSPELEFFLIDNGSPDRCGDICREYAKRDSRFRVFTLRENIGYIRARNLGIQAVDGDYIGFCDSDDYLEPGGYDRAIEKIKETNCDLYLAAYKTVCETREQTTFLPYETGLYRGCAVQEVIRPQAFGRLPGRDVLHGFAWKQIVRRSIVAENGFAFMEVLKPYEDQLFNVDIIGKCNSVYVDNVIIYNYIVNEASITAQLYSKFNEKEEYERIRLLYCEKKRRVRQKIELEANCNESLEMLYECILAMIKQNTSMREAARRCRVLFCDTEVQGMLDGSSQNVSLPCRVCRMVIRLKTYGTFVCVMRLLLRRNRRVAQA